jgi:hypothetical protein
MSRHSRDAAPTIPAPTPEVMLQHGRNIIPVRLDKRPLIPAWAQFQHMRVSASQVEEWARKLRPPAWAVITGAISGLIILDFDGDSGNATWLKLALNPHVRTGSGGHHLYVQHPGVRVAKCRRSSKNVVFWT